MISQQQKIGRRFHAGFMAGFIPIGGFVSQCRIWCSRRGYPPPPLKMTTIIFDPLLVGPHPCHSNMPRCSQIWVRRPNAIADAAATGAAARGSAAPSAPTTGHGGGWEEGEGLGEVSGAAAATPDPVTPWLAAGSPDCKRDGGATGFPDCS